MHETEQRIKRRQSGKVSRSQCRKEKSFHYLVMTREQGLFPRYNEIVDHVITR